MALLPYNPTTVLTSTKDANIIYIFRHEKNDPLGPQLVALNATTTLTSTSFSTTSIGEALPFFDSDNGVSFSALMGSQGTIYVYAGQCSDGPDGASLWAFIPSLNGPNGTWTQEKLSLDGTMDATGFGGANFLAAGMEFSSTVNGTSDLYIFGGMCPNSTTLDVKDWQFSANYSDSMITLQPALTSSGAASDFTLSTVSSRGPPIPEAGFTVTGLQPTFFSTSSGNNSQQQNFVLLGGHTQNAFINMSQVALFSLPQQTWAFLPVDSPQTSAKTGLTVKDAESIDPRSGHTAILSSDGKQIVVFGGWVGDVTTPASPQLAILELGEDYGGNGDWQWTVPDQNGVGPPSAEGIYGHGATMLPGEVMMVFGGYSTSSSNNASSTEPETSQNTATYFFNVSSNAWSSTYTNPAQQSSAEAETSGTLSPGTKVGLGAGLGVGLAAIIVLIIACVCYNGRVNRRKAAREKELRDLALGAHRFHSSALGLGGIDGRGGEQSAVEYIGRGGQDAYPWGPPMNSSGEVSGWRGTRNTEAERTGLLVEIPSPTRGLRRSLYSRGPNQQPTWHDDGRRSRASGNIHPIDERGEYEEDRLDEPPATRQEMTQHNHLDLLATVFNLDPFVDPLGSHPVGGSRSPSPESPARERQREVRSWMTDWTAAENLMHQQAGRTSPDKTDRTSSTLSERSTHSTVSALSVQQSVGTISRSISQRSGAIFTPNLFVSNKSPTKPSPTFETRDGRTSPQERSLDYRRSQSLTLDIGHRRTNTAETFTTASTSFSRLQAEGETLLGRHGELGSTVPNRSQSSRARGWVGTMRRAFTGRDRSTSRSPIRGDVSSCSSPTKYDHTETGIPKRAASAGAMLWRTRQGAKDWNVEGAERGEDAGGQVSDERQEEEEWDVESAVERRVVQVMFTVPKEKLRVVNAGPDGDDASVVSMERDSARDGGLLDGKGKQREE